MKSRLEETLVTQLSALRVPAFEREFKFDPGRRWRADFAWPDERLLVEVEGGQWIAGRHQRGKGYFKDCDKYNAAQLNGYKVLRFTTDHIISGQAALVIANYFEVNKCDI